jgi:hypothetical protein
MARLSCSPFNNSQKIIFYPKFAEGYLLYDSVVAAKCVFERVARDRGTVHMQKMSQRNRSTRAFFLSKYRVGEGQDGFCTTCKEIHTGTAGFCLSRLTLCSGLVLRVHVMACTCVCVTVQINSVGDSDTALCEIYTINLMLTRANVWLYCYLSMSRVICLPWL